MREVQPCVYVMANGRLGTLYVGLTSNLIGRVMQHRNGTYDGFTKQHRINRLVWYEVGDTMEGAISREKALKKWR
ncbi:MAG: GIY-YIG nuclease family protein [Sphingomonas sp.]